MAKIEENKSNPIEEVEHVMSSTEAFIEKNQKNLLIGLGVVVVVVLGFLGFKYKYLEPREIAARNEIYKAQLAFSADSFKIALEGKGVEITGFRQIADEYSITSTGKLANAYAGICLFKLGKYDEAIDYLKKYNADGSYFGVSVVGLIGDCYVNLGNNDDAIKNFEKAIAFNNDVLSPIYLKKLGLLYESTKQPEKALESYQAIKDKYPASTEVAEIDKFIARVQK